MLSEDPLGPAIITFCMPESCNMDHMLLGASRFGPVVPVAPAADAPPVPAPDSQSQAQQPPLIGLVAGALEGTPATVLIIPNTIPVQCMGFVRKIEHEISGTEGVLLVDVELSTRDDYVAICADLKLSLGARVPLFSVWSTGTRLPASEENETGGKFLREQCTKLLDGWVYSWNSTAFSSNKHFALQEWGYLWSSPPRLVAFNTTMKGVVLPLLNFTTRLVYCNDL